MVLVDALYVNTGGGLVLLQYLIRQLGRATSSCHFLIDSRCEQNSFDFQESDKVEFVQASLYNRYKFYRNLKVDSYSGVLCFGNIAPPLKLDIEVITYLHQRLFLEIPIGIEWKQRSVLKLKSFVFKQLLRNTNKVLVQTNDMKKVLSRSTKFLDDADVVVCPFYESLAQVEAEKISNTYLYVSSGEVYKNHVLLLTAFKKFYDEYRIGSLILTVPAKYSDLHDSISEMISMGYPIQNLGYVSREKLASVYQASEYIIYPSLSESFGLGLVEGIEFKCKVIAADLNYVHEVCVPSLVFNPLSIDDLVDAFTLSIKQDVPPSISKITNGVFDLIQMLKFSRS